MKYEAIAQCRRPRVILILTAVLLCGVAHQAAIAGTTERVSVDSNGTQANERSFMAAISADGHFVAFVSEAGNLVAGDTNGDWDIFVHDRYSGVTERVSVSSGGAEGNDYSDLCDISADGRFVVFESRASNLVPYDTLGKQDIFIHDRQTSVTERVSVPSAGSQADGASQRPSVSGDGRFVAFVSFATNLVAGDTNDRQDIFVRDRLTAVTERVSVSSGGTQANSRSEYPSISADGRFVAFESAATNLVIGESNTNRDVFVHDRLTRATTRASLSSDGAQSNNESYWPSISSDGRFVAFVSSATNLIEGDTNSTSDILVRDRALGKTSRVNIASDGTQANNWSAAPAISDNGRFVAFRSLAGNLVEGDTNLALDFFVHDRQARREGTGTTTRVSIAYDGAEANNATGEGSISADGRFVTFPSYATNLVPNDTNDTNDIFVRDRTVWLIVAISGGGKGMVSATPPGGMYVQGETVEITAEPFAYSSFDHWEGDLTGSENPAEIVMDGDMTITAHFVRQCFVSVKSVLPTAISITGDKPGITDYVAMCDDGKILHLTAPESVAVGDMVWYFQYWAAYNEHALPVPLLLDGQVAADMELLIDRDRTLMAVYDWRPEGDVNRDCTVNILDMLSVRNRLQTGCVHPSP